MTSNSQSTKSLGQVAFEAYFKQRFGTDCDWSSEERHGAHPAWQAAAEAVVAVTTAPNIVSGTIDTKTGNVRIHSPAELTARDKVIEAANALHAKMNRGEFASTADEQAGVWQAVEALQEVEGD